MSLSTKIAIFVVYLAILFDSIPAEHLKYQEIQCHCVNESRHTRMKNRYIQTFRCTFTLPEPDSSCLECVVTGDE